MDPVNPAKPVAGISCPGCGKAVVWGVAKLFGWLWSRGIPVGILLVCLGCVLIVIVVRIVRRRKRVAGTAQVLSVETMTTGEGPVPSYTCRIALRVEIPGRPAYDATSSNGEFMTPIELAAIQPGKTVAVQVDSTNPQDVWIDFSSIT
jgi:hypothetical protein